MNRFSVASTALLHCAGVYFDIFRMSKNVRPRLVNVTEIEYGWIGHISLSHKSLRMCVWVGVSEWVSEWVCVCVWEREREKREREEREKREKREGEERGRREREKREREERERREREKRGERKSGISDCVRNPGSWRVKDMKLAVSGLVYF